jgi:hypothetical protein
MCLGGVVSPEKELLDLLRQLSSSHFALMRAVLALQTNVNLISINFEAGVPPTDADKKHWQELRDEFQKQLQVAFAAMTEPPS